MRAASLALRVVAHPLAPLASAPRRSRLDPARVRLAFAEEVPTLLRSRSRPRSAPVPRAPAPLAMVGPDDEPIDEARVMRGDDAHRPAVEAAVAIFDRDRRPRRRSGRSSPTRARRPRRARRARAPRKHRRRRAEVPAPDRDAGRVRLRRLPAAAARGRGKSAMTSPPDAVDLTGDDDDGRRRRISRRRRSKRRKTAADQRKGKEPARETTSAKTVSGNALMAQLAAERRARDPSREMARGERGGPEIPRRRLLARRPGSGSASAGRSRARPAAAMVGGGPGASSRSTPGGGILAALASIPDGTRPDPAPPPGSRVDVQRVVRVGGAHGRVQGLSGVVRRVDPHVLCLQEVTPNILMLLHAQPWMRYKGTPPQQYFTVVMFKRYLDKPTGPSSCVARFDSRMGRSRTASPRSTAAAGWNSRSCPRTSRASSGRRRRAPPSAWRSVRTLRALEGCRLAPRGEGRESGAPDRRRRPRGRGRDLRGDLNWDEATARAPPLPPGWEDAWLVAGDGTEGYTYDAKRNEMLGGWLRKRLDRAFCKLGLPVARPSSWARSPCPAAGRAGGARERIQREENHGTRSYPRTTTACSSP